MTDGKKEDKKLNQGKESSVSKGHAALESWPNFRIIYKIVRRQSGGPTYTDIS